MAQTILCHLLIGLPASGKSTFALKLQQQIPNSIIVSTDAVRLKLYGDATIQGNWNTIEQEVIKQVKLAIANQQSVIYDATNVKAAWRISFMNQLQDTNTQWIAWWLKTPVPICQQQNLMRSRQVPNHIINIFGEYLLQSPPTINEGFLTVKEIELNYNTT